MMESSVVLEVSSSGGSGGSLSKSQLKKMNKREAFLRKKVLKKQFEKQHVVNMRKIKTLLDGHDITTMTVEDEMKKLADKLQISVSDMLAYRDYDRKLKRKRHLRKDLKRAELKGPESPMTTILIDMQFESLMTDSVREMFAEIMSISKQLERCYAANRRISRPVSLVVSSFGGRVKERFESVLKGSAYWKLEYQSRYLTEIYDNDSLIYLTSDSPHVLKDIDPKKIYVIGGLVDRNRHKGLTFAKAEELGISTAHLPIGDYVSMASRKVLTVNHVFEILLKYLETQNWSEAFLKVIPLRKGAVRLETLESSNSDELISETVISSSSPIDFKDDHLAKEHS